MTEPASGTARPRDPDWLAADPASAQVLDRRYDYYRVLRSNAPVHLAESVGGSRLCLITRHHEVAAAFVDPGLVRDYGVPRYAGPPRPATRGSDFGSVIADWMVYRDAPDHPRLRAPIYRTLKRLAAAIPVQLRPIVSREVERVREAGRTDLVDGLAYVVPARVVCDLVGIPCADLGPFRRWMHGISAALEQPGSARAWDAGDGVVDQLVAILTGLVHRARRGHGTPFLRGVVDLATGVRGIEDRELVANLVLFLFAGHETTRNLIANTFHCLLRHPEQMRMLCRRPELVRSSVEEVLRFESPVQVTYRGTIADHRLGGVSIPARTRVALVMGSANRDESVFADPDRFDVQRPRVPHLAFGHRSHFCPGAGVARHEAILCVHEMLRRCERLELVGAPAWRPSLTYRALDRLEVEAC